MQKSASERPAISLDDIGTRNALAKRIAEDLDAHTEEFYYEGFRNHLGASVIGDECKRRLWYMFRWCASERPSGRQQRLFNRGNLEENRHFEWLHGMGFEVYTHDESAPLKADGTRPQYRIANSCGGHFGGSVDAIIRFPAKYNIAEPALLSCKTSGTGAGFNKVKTDESLRIAKPEHYIQESVYGYKFGIEYVLYICANKNDDDLAIRVEKLDFKLAEQMEVKAEAIIFAQDAPPRYSENPTAIKCKNFCEFKDICHYHKEPARNCRSCVYLYAKDDKLFWCKKWDQTTNDRTALMAGCGQWTSINGPTAPDVRQPGKFEIENVAMP